MAKILHIEDDPANRLLVRKLLSVAGHVVVEAESGLEGVRLARRESPDLVLVDLALPELDGYEVTLRLRAEPVMRDVPIVAITAEGDRDTSLAVGCDGFLEKPIDARSFERTVTRYLRGARDEGTRGVEAERLRARSQQIVAHLEAKVDELARANARLVELDRARAAFYRNVSHELATPMTPIVGYVKLLAEGELGPVTARQAKALASMGGCVERLRGLIDDLLDVGALERGTMRFASETFDVVAALDRALATVAPGLEARGISLVRAPAPASLAVVGDPERLGRALAHVLANASKFTPPRGSVGVAIEAAPGAACAITIADTGPGLSPERAAEAFEPFWQADASPTREHGGVGAGLAIARGIARGLGGDLELVAPGGVVVAGRAFGGAAFRFTVARGGARGGEVA